MDKITEEIEKAIMSNKAIFIGEGEWVKDGAYQVYEYESRYFAVIVYDSSSKWLLEGSIVEIAKSDIEKYI